MLVDVRREMGRDERLRRWNRDGLKKKSLGGVGGWLAYCQGPTDPEGIAGVGYFVASPAETGVLQLIECGFGEKRGPL